MIEKEIRASYDNSTITVYQAFNKDIADAAIRSQNFDSPLFKANRMTWIKPSFLWMMYRSGWATKMNQERILSIQITHDGFQWALKNSCLTSFEQRIHKDFNEWRSQLSSSPIRIQWDPEKNIFSKDLSYKTIQIGLSGTAVHKYIFEWIKNINDITDDCKRIQELISRKELEIATKLLPNEIPYKVSDEIASRINLS